MNEHGYESNPQYDNGQYSNGYEQQYDGQQYGNGYDQQYNGQQHDGSFNDMKESLPDGVMERLPGWMRDRVDDIMVMAEQENLNRARYGHVEPYEYKSHRHPLVTAIAIVIGIGGAFYFVFIKPNYMIALICFGIMLLIYGIGYLTDKNYCFRKEPAYTMIPVLGVIFILIAAYHLLARNIPTLPQPESRGIEVWGCGLFVVLGVVLLILDCISYCCMKKVCTEPVSAVCVYVKVKVVKSDNRSTAKYSGVFEYQFRGNTYLAAEPFRDKDVPKVGDRYELYINPGEPTDFYRKSWKLLVSSLIGYMLFIVFPIIICSQL